MTNRLVLWDIDGTLIRGGVVGAEVFELAIERVLGARPRAQVRLSGKTDRQIAEEFLAIHGSEDPRHIPAVLYHLEQELALRVDRIASEYSACPGVEAVLRALSEADSVEQTVLTGNIAPNAVAKLAPFGLDRYLDLEVGAYGSDHADRRSLLPLAWRLQRELRDTHYLPAETWIVGDTPRDFDCARAGGAHCLLVATGRYELAELQALGADVAIDDLSNPATVVDILTSANN
ncbi:MAG: HAD family hydrolase [Acidimicrobiales bacterium]